MLLEDNIIKTWAFVAYAYVVDVHVTPENGYFWIMSAEHFNLGPCWLQMQQIANRRYISSCVKFCSKRSLVPKYMLRYSHNILFTHTVSVSRI